MIIKLIMKDKRPGDLLQFLWTPTMGKMPGTSLCHGARSETAALEGLQVSPVR